MAHPRVLDDNNPEDFMKHNVSQSYISTARGCTLQLRNLIVLTIASLFLLGCPTRTSVADINRDPAKYQGKEITIVGKVSDAFGALGTGVYQVDDGTGRLWIFSQNYGVPGLGAQVAVTGRLEQGFSFGGRSFALALRQTQARH